MTGAKTDLNVCAELSAEETANYFKRLRWLECTLDPGSHFFSSEGECQWIRLRHCEYEPL